jgi:hypothetical protein
MMLGREAYVGGGSQQWREASALWAGPEAHRQFLRRSSEDALAVSQAFDHDVLRLDYWRLPSNERLLARKDELTFVFAAADGRRIVRRYDPHTELFQAVQPPQQAEQVADYRGLEERLVVPAERAAEKYSFAGELPEVRRRMQTLGQTHALRFTYGGMHVPIDSPIVLEATIERPDLVERHLDAQLTVAMKQLQGMAAAGARLMFGGGDLASATAPMFSPASFRRFLTPRLRALVSACHRHDVYFIFASDGNLWPVADELFLEAGVDGYCEVDRRAGMDLVELRKRYPRLTLIGNVSSHTVHRGTPQEVADEVRSCLDAAKEYGRIIVGVSNYIVPGTPEENVRALAQTILRYR